MRFLLSSASCLVSLSLMQPAVADGPVRRALRGAGEAAAQGTRDVVRGTARGVGAAADAVTPRIPDEASAGGPIDRNARWRFQHHNGDWWYYAPNNAWMYQRSGNWQTYDAATYTAAPQPIANPSIPPTNDQSSYNQDMVFIDSGGRAVLCQSGRITFVDGTALRSVPRAQINAQGYLIEGPPQGQSTVGVAGQAELNQQQSVVRTENAAQAPVGAAAPPQPQTTGQAQVQGQVNATPPASPAQTPAKGSPASVSAGSNDAAGADNPGDAPRSDANADNSKR